jgi:CopG family nickel-responsive transcriptional regulator
MHVHLDHDSCLEVAVLRGEAAIVREFANTIIAERGVSHGQVSFVPVAVHAAAHDHGGASHRHVHTHEEIASPIGILSGSQDEQRSIESF